MRARIGSRLHRDDAGTTLAELIAGMGVLVVFMTIFTAAIFTLNNATAHTESVDQTASNVNRAFLRLDKMVRYASAISAPSATADANGRWWVELQTTNTGATVCTQLQLDTNAQQLRYRTWTMPTSSTYQTPTGWTTVASNVIAYNTPFALQAASDVSYERLTVGLTSAQGTGPTASDTDSSMAFTAINSQRASASASRDSTQPGTVCRGPGRTVST